jgi:hypothetical protein
MRSRSNSSTLDEECAFRLLNPLDSGGRISLTCRFRGVPSRSSRPSSDGVRGSVTESRRGAPWPRSANGGTADGVRQSANEDAPHPRGASVPVGPVHREGGDPLPVASQAHPDERGVVRIGLAPSVVDVVVAYRGQSGHREDRVLPFRTGALGKWQHSARSRVLPRSRAPQDRDTPRSPGCRGARNSRWPAPGQCRHSPTCSDSRAPGGTRDPARSAGPSRDRAGGGRPRGLPRLRRLRRPCDPPSREADTLDVRRPRVRRERRAAGARAGDPAPAHPGTMTGLLHAARALGARMASSVFRIPSSYDVFFNGPRSFWSAESSSTTGVVCR